MRKIIYCLAAMLLFSCTKNESVTPQEESVSNKQELEGKWQLQSYIQSGVNITTDCDKNGTLTFDSNSNFTQTIFDASANSCSQLAAIQCSFDPSSETFSDGSGNEGHFSITGDVLTLIFSNEDLEGMVVTYDKQ